MEAFFAKLAALGGPLLLGAVTTVAITLASLVVAILLGLAFALIRLLGIRPVNGLINAEIHTVTEAGEATVNLDRLLFEHEVWPLLKGELVIHRILLDKPVTHIPRCTRKPWMSPIRMRIDKIHITLCIKTQRPERDSSGYKPVIS